MLHQAIQTLLIVAVFSACYVQAHRAIRCEHAKRDTLDIRCPRGTTIDILYSNYGRTSVNVPCRLNARHVTKCIQPKSKYIVKHLCQGKSVCWVKASNYVFGDPCYGIVKYVDVQWICNACKPRNPCHNGGQCSPVGNSYRCTCRPGFGGNNCEKRIACEGQKFHIHCPPGTVIRVNSANYGRTGINAGNCRINAAHVTTCFQPKTMYLVKHQCENRHACSLKAVNYVFGDPCFGVTKYLEIDWSCVHH